MVVYHDHEHPFECMMFSTVFLTSIIHIHSMSYGSLGPEFMPLSELPDKVRQHRGASAEVEAA